MLLLEKAGNSMEEGVYLLRRHKGKGLQLVAEGRLGPGDRDSPWLRLRRGLHGPGRRGLGLRRSGDAGRTGRITGGFVRMWVGRLLDLVVDVAMLLDGTLRPRLIPSSFSFFSDECIYRGERAQRNMVALAFVSEHKQYWVSKEKQLGPN